MNVSGNIKLYSAILIILTIFCFAAVILFVPPIHQSLNYHQFSDTREIFGIPNFMNVISNILFCLVSISGFVSLQHKWKDNKLSGKEAIVFLIIFIGIFLTGIGSSYYHWNPDNANLVWDRLPMTIVFMSLLSLTIMEKVDLKIGFWLLAPLIIFGIWTVWYWHLTDDLRLYGLVQFYSMFLIVAILCFFHNPYPPLKLYVWMLVFYCIAKGLEYFDASIYTLSGFISGHSLKHIAAAISAYCIVLMLNDGILFREIYEKKK